MGRPATIRGFYLILALSLGTGCAEDILTSIGTVTDEFLQNVAASIDVLWVVDNSESMEEEQDGLGASFQAFIDKLVASQVDYHIGVISTDVVGEGRLHYTAVPYIDNATPNQGPAFLENVRVGIVGSRTEKAFETTALALGRGTDWVPGTPATPPNFGFMRDEAALFIIMVSDEDDKSFGPVKYYWRLFESTKGRGNEAQISVSAIVGPPGVDGGCTGSGGAAAPGDRYVELAGLTGGIWASICGDFNESLRQLSITAAGLRSTFELSSLPNLDAFITGCDGHRDAFCVRVDGTVIAKHPQDGWSYDVGTNSILFGVNAVPTPQAEITVEYQEAL